MTPNLYGDRDRILGRDKPDDWEAPVPSLKTRMAEALQNTTSERCSGVKGPTAWGRQLPNERPGPRGREEQWTNMNTKPHT